jgi:DNA-binding protein Fis
VLDEGMKSRRPELYRHLIQQFDALVLANVMRAAGGLQSRAAEILGLSRPTLRAKLRLMSRRDVPAGEAIDAQAHSD